ncbi:MAG: uroporphyrinogen-III C-methyltransferase [Deltaproteobacteria bacterium]|nr:MAG: uroporphyrinogen-III C-methyltransferase [Deltaproteobacteria bacterium]
MKSPKSSNDKKPRSLNKSNKGIVYLIGGGPGSPDLITVKAKECLHKADVIVYDYLIDESLLSLGGKDAELLYVGKKSGQHTMSQQEINKLLIAKAEQGLAVARLKGGDPFIFGRGGEEAMELAEAGIQFEIVPGVTSAVAVPAYAGIPLTHRDHSSTVCFITGHEDPTKETSNINWDSLAQSPGTLVFLMGIGNLGNITRKLIHSGRPAHSPVAVISNGTTPNQKTVTGTLENIEQKAKDANLTPPGVIVVGDVVGLRGHLNWFETRPLFGKNILVTRPEDQAAGFVSILSGLGARCVQIPAIRIMPPTTWKELDRAIAGLSVYDWILFTSINGVKYFFGRLQVFKKDARHLSGIKIGVIGPKTAQALLDRGVIPDLIPDKYSAEGIVEALHQYPLTGQRVLLPRPVIARDYLPEELKTLRAKVDVVEAYQTVQPEYDQNQLDDLFKKGAIDMVTFTSSSTVDNFLGLFEGKSVGKEISKILVACIGPITARRATEKGLTVTVVPDEYTGDALARAIVEFYQTL